MTDDPSDRFYFRQLLSGRDFAQNDPMARQMVNFVYAIGDRETGEAVLVARWRVTPAAGKGEVATYQFSATRPLAREGYAGLVDAEIDLAGELAAAIAESLRSSTGR